MSGDPETPPSTGWETPVAGDQPAPAASASGPSDLLAEHPEAIAGAAFVGGLLTALIVRRFGR
ncbi:MAG TPA: hypothetical protein VFB41_00900 [Solirubrobacteraceae bacterium]|nr:hypothetical protein [Solirubrobacteraceae bacterium]